MESKDCGGFGYFNLDFSPGMPGRRVDLIIRITTSYLAKPSSKS